MAVKLTLVLSGRTLARHEFASDFKRLRVGRNEDCDVHIDNLGISRVHCEIVNQPGFVQLRDMQSGNGTFVNGKRIQTYNLNSGDVISLGKYTLRFENDDLDEADKAGGGLAVMPGGAMTLQMDAATMARRHREEIGKNRGYVTVGGRDVILEKSLTVIGADEGADVRVTGWFCPRVVAVIVRDEKGFRLVDVSPRGSMINVNGVPRRDTVLNDNDEIKIRSQALIFRRGLPVGAHA